MFARFVCNPFAAVKSFQFLLYISLYNHPLTPSTLRLLFSWDFSPVNKTSEVAPVLEGYDLMDLAPELHSFVSKFHLSAAMMTELLQKQMLGLAGCWLVKRRFEGWLWWENGEMPVVRGSFNGCPDITSIQPSGAFQFGMHGVVFQIFLGNPSGKKNKESRVSQLI